MPTVLVERRALRHLTIEEVRYELQEALLLRGTPISFAGDKNLLVAKLETLLDDDRPLQLRFARYHTTTKDPIHVTAGIKFHLGPGVKHQLDSVLFAIKEERDGRERLLRSIDCQRRILHVGNLNLSYSA
ncbi:hypothetical protein CF319_g4523 [Tilletia indica]|nr:hypothetical protein CF319_g4523 [Tilletia indica]